MNGMLLAAGHGERMEPLSSFVPKPALDVLGRPLAASSWDHLAPHCRRIVANLHRHGDAVAVALETLAAGGPPVCFSREPELLGGAGGVAAARPLLGPGPVLVANADVWADLDLSPLLAEHDEDTVTLAVLPHPDPRRWSSVVLDDGGRVERILPAGSVPSAPYLFTGFQRLGANVVRALPAPPGEFASLWRTVRARGALRAAVVHGSWMEAGTPRAYWHLVISLLDGRSWCHDGSEVDDDSSVVVTAVGERCRVGGRVLLDRCVVTSKATVSPGCSLRRCVVAGAVTVPPALEIADALVLPSGIVPLR